MFMFINKMNKVPVRLAFITGIAKNTFEVIDNACSVSTRKENVKNSYGSNFGIRRGQKSSYTQASYLDS